MIFDTGCCTIGEVVRYGNVRRVTRINLTTIIFLECCGLKTFRLACPIDPGKLYTKNFMPNDLSLVKPNVLKVRWLKDRPAVYVRLSPNIPPWHCFDVTHITSELEILTLDKPNKQYYLC